MKTDTNGSPRR